MPTVFIPALLQKFTGGRSSVAVRGATVRELIDQLDSQFPGIKARLLDGASLRSGLAVAVGSQIANQGLSEPVSEDAEVHFVPGISGGADV